MGTFLKFHKPYHLLYINKTVIFLNFLKNPSKSELDPGRSPEAQCQRLVTIFGAHTQRVQVPK